MAMPVAVGKDLAAMQHLHLLLLHSYRMLLQLAGPHAGAPASPTLWPSRVQKQSANSTLLVMPC